jgi:hypothetical protein
VDAISIAGDDMSVICPQCKGIGRGCPVCGGKGVIGSVDEHLEVPPEAEQGEIVELNTLLANNAPPDPLDNIKKVIQIGPGSKYVIVVNATILAEDLQRIAESITEWWEGDAKFFVVSDQIELVRVDDDAEAPELVWCGADECPGHEPGSGEACPGQTNNTEPPGPVI